MPVMYYILRYFLVKSEGLEKNIKSEGLDSILHSKWKIKSEGLKNPSLLMENYGHIDNYGL